MGQHIFKNQCILLTKKGLFFIQYTPIIKRIECLDFNCYAQSIKKNNILDYIIPNKDKEFYFTIKPEYKSLIGLRVVDTLNCLPFLSSFNFFKINKDLNNNNTYYNIDLNIFKQQKFNVKYCVEFGFNYLDLFKFIIMQFIVPNIKNPYYMYYDFLEKCYVIRNSKIQNNIFSGIYLKELKNG